MNRRTIVLAVSLIISVFFLVIAFRGLNPAAVWETMQTAQFGWLLLGFFTYFGAMIVISRRWKFLIDAYAMAPLRYLFQVVALGYMGNNLYPFRAGEALRCLLLRRTHQMPIARTAVTILVERAFDGLVMVTFLVTGLALLDLNSEVLRAVATFTLPWFVGALAVFIILAQRPELLRRIVHAVTSRLPERIGLRLASLADDLIGGLAGLRGARDLLGTLITSYLSWMIEATVYYMVALALGLPVSYLLILVVVGAVNLGQLIPSSPGGVGVFEFFASTVLIAAGIPEAQAIAYAVLAHVIIWLPPTLLGLALLPRLGLRMSEVSQASRQTEAV